MPIDASIPLGVKTPDTMQSLSSLLGAANSAQQFQNNNISLNERKAVSQVLSDPSSYTDQDGNIDFNRAAPQIMRVAPTTGMKYIQDMMTAQQQQVAAKQSLNNLTTDVRAQAGKVFYGMDPNTPPDVFHKTVATLRSQYKGGDAFWNMLDQGYDHAVSIGKGPDFIANAAKTTLPQETQQTMASGSLTSVPTDQGTKLVQTKVGAATPQGGQVGQTFAPPNQVVTTPTGHIGSYNTANQTYQEPTPPTAPNAPQLNLPQGETPDTLKNAQNIRFNSNQAARGVVDQQFNSNQIIKLAGETNTGKGAELAKNLTGGYALVPWTSDSASNFNQLGHYMALQTAALSQSSGLGGTDAAHAIAAEQAGNREWTRDAIKNTARVNRALSTGTDLFNRGVENSIAAAGGSPFAARDFQNKWSKTASVDALRIYDAYKNRGDDPDGWAATVKEFGGPNSDKFKRTMQQVDQMKALIRGEQ